MMYGVVRCGNIGVDMFLFLSGIGLWYSWTKQPSLKHFFKRRYLRIYPAWLIMALLFYIPNYLNVAGGGYSPNIGHLVANILFNWSFWRIDDLTFWFIPGTHQEAPLLPLATGGGGHCLGRHGAVLSARASFCWSCGDLLEQDSHLPVRYQLRTMGKREAHHGRRRPLGCVTTVHPLVYDVHRV